MQAACLLLLIGTMLLVAQVFTDEGTRSIARAWCNNGATKQAGCMRQGRGNTPCRRVQAREQAGLTEAWCRQVRQQSSRGARRMEDWHLQRVGHYTEWAVRGCGRAGICSGAVDQERPSAARPQCHNSTHDTTYTVGSRRGGTGRPVT